MQQGSLDLTLQTRDSPLLSGAFWKFERGFWALSWRLPGAIGLYWEGARVLDVFLFMEHFHAMKKSPTSTRHLCR